MAAKRLFLFIQVLHHIYDDIHALFAGNELVLDELAEVGEGKQVRVVGR